MGLRQKGIEIAAKTVGAATAYSEFSSSETEDTRPVIIVNRSVNSSELGKSQHGIEEIMIFILTLLVFSAGNVAITTAEYRTQQACEAAKSAASSAFSGLGITKVAGTCTQKG